MKKIGEGYHYIVYDLGNGRVLKKQKSKFRIFVHILFVNSFLPRAFREYKNALNNIRQTEIINKEIQERFSNLRMFGNPVFLHGIDYEQDKVTIFKEILKSSSREQLKVYINAYVMIIHELWKHGCHEKVFNFTINTGIEKDDSFVLIDFNEISFEKADVLADITNETWKHRWSFTHLWLLFSSKEIQEFYAKRMREELTVDNLESLWEINLTKK